MSNQTSSSNQLPIPWFSSGFTHTVYVLSITSFILNLTVCVLLYRNKRKRQSFNGVLTQYYLLSTVYALYHIAGNIVKHTVDSYHWRIYELFHTSVIWALCHFQINLLLLMAIQRYVAVCYPVKARYLLTSGKTRFQILLSHTVVALYYTLFAVVGYFEELSWFNSMFDFANAVMSIQIMVNVVIYLVIFYKMRRSTPDFDRGTTSTTTNAGAINATAATRNQENIKKSSLFCLLLALTYAIGSFPIFLGLMFDIDWIMVFGSVLVWIDVLFAAVWYICLMSDFQCCKKKTSNKNDNLQLK